MPVFSQFLKSDLSKGVAIGVGAALLAPVAISVLSGAGRPLVRAAMKSGILILEKGRETVAELGEVIEDLVAEAQADLQEARHAGDEAATVAGEHPGGEAPAPGSAAAETTDRG